MEEQRYGKKARIDSNDAPTTASMQTVDVVVGQHSFDDTDRSRVAGRDGPHATDQAGIQHQRQLPNTVSSLTIEQISRDGDEV